MKARQITVAFDEPVALGEIVKMLKVKYPNKEIVIGPGLAKNGIPNDWIIVHDK